jgi:endonuclease/exonuclease/phosphatase family metal-dependent hydrolase
MLVIGEGTDLERSRQPGLSLEEHAGAPQTRGTHRGTIRKDCLTAGRGQFIISQERRHNQLVWSAAVFVALIGDDQALMRFLVFLLCLAVLSTTATGDETPPTTRQQSADSSNSDLTVVSFNILVDFGSSAEVPRWSERRELCVQLLKDSHAQLIGLQEPSPGQMKWLAEQLSAYEVVLYRRTPTDKGYPDAALLYERERFEEKEHGHWWLSPTPEKVSTGFGNTLPRLVVWAQLRDRMTDKELIVFNTHFDNTMPSQARMAELCSRQFEKFTPRGLPMLFIGDFNTDQKRGDYSRLTSGGWRDSYTAAEQASDDGRDDRVATHLGGTRIDHIFYHGEGLTPVAWQRLESPDPARLLSDHYPIRARFHWK